LADLLPAEYHQLLRVPGIQRLQLDVLSSDDALALVGQRLGVPRVSETVSALIYERAEGNPFFIEELTSALRDAGLILVTDGVCQLAPGVDLSALTFPDTVQGVIASRIDQLTPPQQLTLKVASVIGRVFAFHVLHDIYPVQETKAQLATSLDTLQRVDLTPLYAPEPDLAYLFKHVITQEVAYNLLLFAQRRELHCAVAEWYERTYTGDLAPFYPLLAHHWSKAEVESKTVE
ncbi:MAG: guanylate cyclase, partial [Deltaproteobacteria bacterium]|nr:guanylate cyclase [Deltaproteobacteria bacterium]